MTEVETTDWVIQAWGDKGWIAALNDIDRDPLPGELPEDVYRNRLHAITRMFDVEKRYQAEMEGARGPSGLLSDGGPSTPDAPST